MSSLLLICLVALPIEVAESSEIQKLAWMAGSWAGEKDGVRIEEHWAAPRGATMIGMHRDLRGDRTVGFEFFRVVEDSLGLVYLSQPGGQPPTPFRMKSLEDRKVVFENPVHDFPQRILYWLGKDGALHARIDGTIGGKAEFEEWTWKPSTLK